MGLGGFIPFLLDIIAFMVTTGLTTTFIILRGHGKRLRDIETQAAVEQALSERRDDAIIKLTDQLEKTGERRDEVLREMQHEISLLVAKLAAKD